MFPSPTPKSESIRARGVEVLTPLVQGGVALGLFALRAHWAVRGPAFGPLHELFGKVYDGLAETTDRLAECAAALGAVDPMGDAAALAVPKPAAVDGLALCRMLADAIDAYMVALHDGCDRVDELGLVADCNALADVNEAVRKLGWMVRSQVVTA